MQAGLTNDEETYIIIENQRIFWRRKMPERQKRDPLEVTARFGNMIMTVYFLAMTVIFPFYIKDGYREIGKIKAFFFIHISLITAGIMLTVIAIDFWLQRKQMSIAAHYRRLSVTDWFVYGYLAAVLLSYLFTDYKKEAFLGAEGWYMGLVSQLLFVSIYFFFSRFFKWNEKWLCVMLLSSGLVFLWGILNRYSVYPLTIYEQRPEFISTLGNINWFCGYWTVLSPLGILWYWDSRGGWKQAAAGIYVVIAFLSGVTQGSSSAHLALSVIFLMMFCLSFRNNRRMYRFLELGILFMLSCQLARLFRYLPVFTMNYEDKLMNTLTDTNLTLYIGLAIGTVYLLFGYLVKYKNYEIAKHKEIRNIVMMLLAAALAGYLALLIANTCIPGGIPGLSKQQIFVFNENWGNSRGATWLAGLAAYRDMPLLQKLAGVGTDCFAEYIYALPELAARVYAQFGDSRLTNAHNEWLTILVNSGALGFVCYAGIFLSAIPRFLKKAQDKPMLYLCAAGVLAYTVHNMVSFQQVLNAPFVFMILGIGEGFFVKEIHLQYSKS